MPGAMRIAPGIYIGGNQMRNQWRNQMRNQWRNLRNQWGNLRSKQRRESEDAAEDDKQGGQEHGDEGREVESSHGCGKY